MINPISQEELDKFLFWVRNNDFDLSMTPEEFGYDKPFLIIIDAVLSINRQYNPFVKPRIELLKQKLSDINNLEELDNLIKIDKNKFIELWHYNHIQRVDLLINLLEFFIVYKKQGGFKDDRAAMVHWASSKKDLPVKGIGFRTNQYLRMMLGVSTVKPDVHLHKAVYEALGKRLSDKEVVEIIEITADKLNLKAISLDHGIWKSRSLKSK